MRLPPPAGVAISAPPPALLAGWWGMASGEARCRPGQAGPGGPAPATPPLPPEPRRPGGEGGRKTDAAFRAAGGARPSVFGHLRAVGPGRKCSPETVFVFRRQYIILPICLSIKKLVKQSFKGGSMLGP